MAGVKCEGCGKFRKHLLELPSPLGQMGSPSYKCEECADCHTKATVRRWFDRNPFREAGGLVQPGSVRPLDRNMDRR